MTDRSLFAQVLLPTSLPASHSETSSACPLRPDLCRFRSACHHRTPSSLLSSSSSQETRQHDEALLLVLIPELLAVGLLLAPAPDIHVIRADDDEDDEGGGARDEDDADPGDDLEHVVRAGDEAEAEAAGDLAGGLARLPQGGEVPVDVCVGELAEEVEGEAEEVEGG